MVSAQTKMTSDERLASLSREDLPRQDQDTTGNSHIYEIHDLKYSENAILLFNNQYVFKILRPYKDHRYSLKELLERQACLLEGLYWNRLFSQDVYYGLAHYYESSWIQGKLSSITLGEFLNTDLEQKSLISNVEYVLVMEKLHSEDRLDILLKKSNRKAQLIYVAVLVKFLKGIHTDPVFPSVVSDQNDYWGSIKQLANKLDKNLVSVEKPDISDTSILESTQYDSLKTICKSLRETLFLALTNETLQQYFVRRIKKQRIKRCHGDLKARNIWITPKGVRVLDAVDFNPEFCNIDTLSDFAMLVADVHARIDPSLEANIYTCVDSPNLVNSMIEDYLRLTKQRDKDSRFVLNYYLVEKAFVGALVSILYDRNWWLGPRYLEVCDRYLKELKTNLPHTPQTALVSAH